MNKFRVHYVGIKSDIDETTSTGSNNSRMAFRNINVADKKYTTSESKSQEVSDKKLDSDRDTSLDPRTLLTNALESVAVTEDEKTFLKAYKDQIDILNKQTKNERKVSSRIWLCK